jgi:hypothetical protein
MVYVGPSTKTVLRDTEFPSWPLVTAVKMWSGYSVSQIMPVATITLAATGMLTGLTIIKTPVSLSISRTVQLADSPFNQKTSATPRANGLLGLVLSGSLGKFDSKAMERLGPTLARHSFLASYSGCSRSVDP